MSTQSVVKIPRWFWVVAGTAAVWVLIGVMTYITMVTMSPEALAELPEAERALMEGMPTLVISAYAIAVFAGTLGCAALLSRKGWSFLLFVLSLVAILVQMVYTLFMSEHLDVYGPSGSILPGLIILVASFLVWFSRHANSRGWLS